MYYLCAIIEKGMKRAKTFKRKILLNRRRRSTKDESVEQDNSNNIPEEEYDSGSTIPVIVAIIGMLIGVALLVKYVL